MDNSKSQIDLFNSSSETLSMTSREIAEVTNKQHKHVLVDIDKLNENYVNLGMAEISAVTYKHPVNGRELREFQLNKIQTLDLMTGYSIELRIKINRRWEELEKLYAYDHRAPEISTADISKLCYAVTKLTKQVIDMQNVLFAKATKPRKKKVKNIYTSIENFVNKNTGVRKMDISSRCAYYERDSKKRGIAIEQLIKSGRITEENGLYYPSLGEQLPEIKKVVPVDLNNLHFSFKGVVA